METQNEISTEVRKRRLAELDRIIAIQSARNVDLTEADAEALIQRYLAEDRDERSNLTRTAGNES